MASVLIADSGSTKIEWCLIIDGKVIGICKTNGINPYFISDDESRKIIAEELKFDGYPLDTIDKIDFYSAGVKSNKNKEALKHILSEVFNCREVNVETDMLAAARATCGKEKGITCILGTGSNACYYDGNDIERNSPSLGYVLGDEGGGAYMGKKVLQYFFYKTFDEDLNIAFINKYGDNLQEVLDKIYRSPFPNRYLATFTHFLVDHQQHYMIQNIIDDALLDFFQRHILKFRESWKAPINFVGSIADQFKENIATILSQHGLEMGVIVKSPINGLIKYHLNN